MTQLSDEERQQVLTAREEAVDELLASLSEPSHPGLASLGLPGLSGFVGEFLSLVGAFEVWRWQTVVSVLGIIAGGVWFFFIRNPFNVGVSCTNIQVNIKITIPHHTTHNAMRIKTKPDTLTVIVK